MLDLEMGEDLGFVEACELQHSVAIEALGFVEQCRAIIAYVEGLEECDEAALTATQTAQMADLLAELHKAVARLENLGEQISEDAVEMLS